ncbi:LysR family transcriptional regulator [Pseudomonas sp. S2_A02]|jgi:DNA-binding transcriptional LysR family regulator
MNFRQLETFLVIAELGSFSAAADRLCVTQSTISARIIELEQDLGVELFDRSQRHVQLTFKGRELVVYAQQMETLSEQIKHTVGSKHSLTGIIRIGVAELVAMTWLPKFAALIRARYSGLQVEYEVGLNPFLSEGIRSGNLDLAVVAGLSPEPGLIARDLGTVSFAWMASDSLIPSNEIMPVEELRKWPILYQGTESYTNNLIDDLLNLPIGRKQRAATCNSLGAIISLARGGLGISLLPISSCASYIKSGELKILKTAPECYEMPFTAVYDRHPNANLLAAIADISYEASSFHRR